LQATLRGHRRISYAQFSPDGRRILSSSYDGSVRVWKVADATQQHVYRDHGGTVYGAAFDHEGGHIASAGVDNRVVVRSLTGGPPVIHAGHRDWVLGVAFSPNDRQLLSASKDGTIRILDARRASSTVRVLRGHDGPVNTATFSPDGQQVLSGGADRTVRVWSLRGERPVVLRGHQGAVESVAFDPTGDRIVSSGVDGTVRIWDPHGGEPLVTLREYRDRAWTGSFSPNGANILSSGDDTVWLESCEVCGTTADIVKLARARVHRQLSGSERERFLGTP
ncbi:MAG: WD40 repeat domain-containing protein, partial [Candidatus Limnocylindria bacterium]